MVFRVERADTAWLILEDSFPIPGAIVCCDLPESDLIGKPFGRLVELVETVVLLGISMKRLYVDRGTQPYGGRSAVLVFKWFLQWDRHVFL
jgi:hypothetical protein